MRANHYLRVELHRIFQRMIKENKTELNGGSRPATEPLTERGVRVFRRRLVMHATDVNARDGKRTGNRKYTGQRGVLRGRVPASR